MEKTLELASKHGISETKELVEGVMEISLRLIDIFKDGLDVSDAAKIWDMVRNDEVLKSKIVKAYEGHKKIPAEIADADSYEVVELMSCLLVFIPKIMDALKKDKPQ